MYNFDTYKENPVISLKKSENDKYAVNFGLYKAKLILENIDGIKEFVNKHENSDTGSSVPAWVRNRR